MGDTTTSYSYAYGPELKPYATKMIGIGQDVLYNTPFQAYTGQRVAGFSPLQTQAFSNIQGMQPSAYTGQGAALAGLAGTNQFTGANVNQFMNPYVSTMQQDAIRNYAKQLPSFGARSAQVGGLGGSRSAILEADAQSNLQQQLQGIQANAFESARDQFNKANANQLAAAGMLGNLGQQDYTQAMGINQALMGAGALQQAGQQQALNNSYNQFMEERNYPLQQLTNMAALLRGVPMQNVTTSTSLPQISPAAQMLGMAAGFGGFYNAFGGSSGSNTGSTSATGGKAAGGEIKSYKGGGIVSLATGGAVPVDKMGAINASLNQRSQSMPPQQADAQVQQTISAMPESVDWQNAYNMLKYTKDHPVTPPQTKPDTIVVQMAKQIAAQADAEKAAQMQQAQQAQQQQMAMQQAQQMQQPQQGLAGLPVQNIGQNYTPTGITAPPQDAVDQQMQQAPQVNAAEGGGIADLQADNIGQNYAGGGIVAFEDGGDVKHFVDTGAVRSEPFVGSFNTSIEPSTAPNWTYWKPQGTMFTEEEIADILSNSKTPMEDMIDRYGRATGRLLSKAGGVKGIAKGSVAPLAMVVDAYASAPDRAYEFEHDPNIPFIERAKQSALDVAPALGGGAGAIVGGTAGTVASGGNPLVGFGAGTAGYYGGKKLVSSVLPERTQYFEEWLKNHPEQVKNSSVKKEATTDGTHPPIDTSKVDLSKYLPTNPSGLAAIDTRKIDIGQAANIDPDQYKPEELDTMIEHTMNTREKYGIGEATKNFLKYLDQREAELAGDEKFNHGMALAQFGFRMLSTPGSFAQSLGAGGTEYAQNMMALKKEENAAKLGLRQARLQGELGVEQGKASAIDSATNMHEQQLGRYQNAVLAQAQLYQTWQGNVISAHSAENQARYQQGSLDLQAQQLAQEYSKNALEINFNKAVLAQDAPAIELFKNAIEMKSKAQTAYLSSQDKLDDVTRATLFKDQTYNKAYTAYTNATDAATKEKAYMVMVQRAKMLGITEEQVAATLSFNRGPLK